jgi:hypothetical protein
MALLKLYLHKRILGFNDKDCGFSCLLRDGQITRQQALARLENEGDIKEDIIKQIFQDLQLDYSALETALRRRVSFIDLFYRCSTRIRGHS